MFLRRALSEIRVNNYNETLLKCWEANMDIQYILDPYACAAYIVSYISKGQRGMSNLLSTACRESKNASSNIRDQVRKVGNTFLNHVEVGAQEACYLVLQMPLRRSSRDVVFVDTNPESERVTLMKPNTVLKELPKASTSVESDSTIKRYQRRPKSMSKLCLADFVALYTVQYGKKRPDNHNKNCSKAVPEELPETYDHDSDDDQESSDVNVLLECEEHVFHDGTVMVKRQRPRVLYSVGYSKGNDNENYFREQLMLYLPWKKYSDILANFSSYEERYVDNQGEIERKRKNYVCDYTINISELEYTVSATEECSVISELQHQDECDAESGSRMCEEYGCFNPGTSFENNDYDLALDLNIGRKQIPNQDEQLARELTDDEYRNLVRTLNVKQKEFFYHVLNWMKTKTDPLYHFLSGGAGVGKSVLLKALYQALVKHFSHQPGENPDDVHILICAPTGKAAFNVGGCTVHSAFNIPADQGFHYKPLDMQQLSNFQSKFKFLKLLFIDEISMVGKNMFNFINLRLQEILGCIRPFGGISVICFGDLFQLKPVFDQWIFASSNTESIASLGTNLWTDHFLLFELDQIMRQKDDLEFAEMLNRIREGNHLEEDITALKMQILEEENDTTRNVPHLFTHRCDVQNYNRTIFQHVCNSKKTIVEAIDSISGDLPSSLHEKILMKIPEDATKTKGLNKYLCLGEGLPAEICVNIDVSDGLANGTPCTISKLDFRVPGSSRCSIVWVKFCSEDIGKKCRTQYQHLFSPDISSTWTPIIETTRKFNISYYKSFHVTRRQFPLCLAAAKTVHKAQGCTLESAVLGLGKKK